MRLRLISMVSNGLLRKLCKPENNNFHEMFCLKMSKLKFDLHHRESWLDQASRNLVEKLRSMRPRVVGRRTSAPPVVVFTDGACEGDRVTIGGVISPSGSSRPEEFGVRVPQKIWDKWERFKSQSQVTGQGELLRVLIAKLTWPHYLSDRRAIFFID